jgi:hypothetical protein
VSSYTRRSGLALIASGVGVSVLETLGATQIVADRNGAVTVASDDNALIGLDGLDEGTVYEEPSDVTITNNTGVDLTGTNEISVVAGDLMLRENEQDDSTTTLSPGTIAAGDTYAFQIVTASDRTGKVTDDVVVDLERPDGVSVRAERTVTVEFKVSARLVYGVGEDLRVYDAVQDLVKNPSDTGSIDAIGATAADVTGDGSVDIPYVDNNDLYITSVGGSNTQIPIGNKPKPNKQKTRLSVGRWPPASLSGPLVFFADHKGKSIYVVDSSGATEEIASPGDGVGGVSGVADIDGDGETEMVFLDGSQQLQYLEQDGTTTAIPNGGVGSNNSAGFGPPVDFTGNGTLRIPFVDGSNQPALVDHAGNKVALAGGVAKKAAVGPVDIDSDGDLEFMYIGNSSGDIEYIDDVGGSNAPTTASIDGSTVAPDEKLGLNSGVELVE